ncbi:hypothetical protein RRG08_012594 [Elysia crispata]|uniref:Uncharacterized protein n=1 Tax=Elysia crispata TaxID=231223 RepID=A0AAE1AI93_9GAST|nr:hypothetical protein RRG08_012594 [Elysia crispata]
MKSSCRYNSIYSPSGPLSDTRMLRYTYAAKMNFNNSGGKGEESGDATQETMYRLVQTSIFEDSGSQRPGITQPVSRPAGRLRG